VRAFTEGTHVIIRVSDDGGGIDPERVRAVAVEKGFVPAASASSLNQEELFQLLFQPGFSTARQVSELSGRGVGLDVVRAQVHRLKGALTLDSDLGLGTTFTIRLPLTLAILRALLVRSGGQTFAVPLGAVAQILRLEDGQAAMLGRDAVVRVNGDVYPRCQLSRALNLRSTDETVARPPVVIVNAGEKQVALVVDRIIGAQEIVVKSLGTHIRRVPGIAGATLMGDGSVVLILNPADLVSGGSTQAMSVRTDVPRRRAEIKTSGRRVMVVDDSPSVRRIATTLLKNAGWDPVVAKDGVEALEILHQGERPNAVLLDVEMPRMDGYEFLSTLRADDVYRDVPVIMITSRAGDKHRRKAMDLGATAYLVKPYQDAVLLNMLQELTGATV
jgi:chemosensory pili system protein ChpA (sensor histidine kinase/response regulator)